MSTKGIVKNQDLEQNCYSYGNLNPVAKFFCGFQDEIRYTEGMINIYNNDSTIPTSGARETISGKDPVMARPWYGFFSNSFPKKIDVRET